MHYCYLIYSPSADRFYTGETSDLEHRLKEHNEGFYVGASTSFTNDWEYFLVLECKDRSHARRVEAFIKRMRNREFYHRLKNDSEAQDSIVKRCK